MFFGVFYRTIRGSPRAIVCRSQVHDCCMAAELANFLNRSREHATVSTGFAIGAARLAGAGLGPWSAGFMTRERTRNDTQETKVLTKSLLANKDHLFGWRPCASSRCGMWTCTLLLQGSAALTEQEERHTVASESLPAHLRKTVPHT